MARVIFEEEKNSISHKLVGSSCYVYLVADGGKSLYGITEIANSWRLYNLLNGCLIGETFSSITLLLEDNRLYEIEAFVQAGEAREWLSFTFNRASKC